METKVQKFGIKAESPQPMVKLFGGHVVNGNTVMIGLRMKTPNGGIIMREACVDTGFADRLLMGQQLATDLGINQSSCTIGHAFLGDGTVHAFHNYYPTDALKIELPFNDVNGTTFSVNTCIHHVTVVPDLPNREVPLLLGFWAIRQLNALVNCKCNIPWPNVRDTAYLEISRRPQELQLW